MSETTQALRQQQAAARRESEPAKSRPVKAAAKPIADAPHTPHAAGAVQPDPKTAKQRREKFGVIPKADKPKAAKK